MPITQWLFKLEQPTNFSTFYSSSFRQHLQLHCPLLSFLPYLTTMPFIPQEPADAELQPEPEKRGVMDMDSIKPEARERMNLLLQQSDPKAVTRPRELSVGPPPPKSVADKVAAAAVVLNRYRIEYKNDWDMPTSIIRSKELIKGIMDRNESIELILPAFPFKSSNKSQKVLGSHPDEAERVSLLHLNGLCESVREETKNGCHLTIISDGIAYNGIVHHYPQRLNIDTG